MSKILIHSIAFSPDAVSTAYLYNDIAIKFKESGFDVSVLTTTPHYNRVENELKKQKLKPKFFGLYYISDFHGIIVKHIPQKKSQSSLLRIFGFVHWHILSFVLGLFEKKIDVIISPSPPLTIGFINILLAKFKNAKTIYNVQEIYPDLLIKQKKIGSSNVIRMLKWLERFVYNKSHSVITIDEMFYNIIVDRFTDKSKLSIIPNFVDTSVYKPIISEYLNIDRSIFMDNSSLKLMYAGNIGFAQDWETLKRLAMELKYDDVVFYVIGEGVMKQWLEKEIEINMINNIIVLPYQHREIIPSLLSYADMQFIFMSSDTSQHGFPSKVYTIMACGKPMLVCSQENTPIINFLKNTNCAYLVLEQNIDIRVKLLVNIIQNTNREYLNEKGRNGLNIIKQYYTKEIVTQKYVSIVNTLLGF